jgi:DUF4097 and DUF4098 domain-containing protein YvlB
MDEKRRKIWTVVIIVAVLLALCCVLAIGAAALLSWRLGFPVDVAWGPGIEGSPMVRTYNVGPAPELLIDGFAGDIIVRAGDSSEIRVTATRHAPRRSDLERIEVDIQAQEGRLEIVTRNPDRLNNARVRLEVLAPAGASFDLRTGAGALEISGLDGGGQAETSAGRVTARDLSGTVSLHTSAGEMSVRGFEGSLKLHASAGGIEVDQISGDLDAHTSVGRISARGAQGGVRLDTSAGSIDYQGSPLGDCSFATGTGSIDLRLPPDLSAKVDLHTGVGSIEVDYTLEGERSRETVRGVIGNGDAVAISAQTGAGSITVRPY